MRFKLLIFVSAALTIVGAALAFEDKPKVSSLDRAVYNAVHKKPPGLRADVDLEQSLAIRMLRLPADTTLEDVDKAVRRRISVAQVLMLGPLAEARFVLNADLSISEDQVMERLSVVDTALCSFGANDVRYGTHCAGYDWYSPFQLLNQNPARSGDVWVFLLPWI